jgi:hypothetical protein
MPTAPQYDTQVQTRATPNVRVNTDAPIAAFGGGELAAAPSQALQKTADIIDRERQKADDLRVLEAETEAANYKTELFYDPNVGAMTKKGRDAFGVVDEFSPKYKKKIDEIATKLSTPAQRQKFMARASQYQVDLDGQLQRHVFAESQSYDNEVTEANLQATQNEIVLNYENPEAVIRGQQRLQDTILSHASRMGKGPEWTKAQVEKSISRSNAAIVERFIDNGEDIKAEEFFKANRDRFQAEDASRVEKKVQESTLLGKAQRLSADAMGRGLSLTHAISEANTIENPKEKAAVKEQIRLDYAQREAAREFDQKKRFDYAAKKLDAAGGDIKSIAGLLPSFDVEEQDALKKRAMAKVSGEATKTDLKLYNELKTLASSPDTQSLFLRRNLEVDATRLSSTDYKKFVDLQAQIRSKGDSASNGMKSNRQVLEQIAFRAGIKNFKGDDFHNLDYQIDQEVDRLRANGDKVDQKRYKDIANQMTLEVITEGTLFNSSKRVFELKPQDKIVPIPIDRIPADTKAKIREYLQKKNLPSNDAAVSKFYTIKLRRGVNATR